MADLFTTRETASAIWLTVLLGWGLRYSSVRSGIASVLRSAIRWKILSVFLGLAIYTGGMIWILIEVGFWAPDLAKDTTLWFVFAGITLAFRVVTDRTEEPVCRRVVTDQVRVIILFEYLVGTYTFRLGWELLLQPIVAGIAMVNAVAQTQEQHSSVVRILGWVQSFLSLAILSTAALRALGDQHSADAIRTIALAPLLSLLFVPALYLLVLGTAYENLFVFLHIGPTKGWRFRWYARWRLFRNLGLSPRRILGFQRQFGLRLSRLTTNEALDSLLAESNVR